MPAPAPFFSIIIVCRNPGPALPAALDSVWGQREAGCEIIVIDGASTDGTVAWLEARRARLAHLLAEPDHGVYDAMNKGLAAARGEWVLFFGADDRLASDSVLCEAVASLKTSAAGVVAGEVTYDDGRIYRLKLPPVPLARNFLHHQGTFYRRSLFGESGGFDPTLSIMGDYDLNLRWWLKGVRFEPLKLPVAVCASGGLSDAGTWRGYREEITVRHRHFPAWHCWPWDVGSLIRYGRKRIVRSQAKNRPE
jgi:glycosyltransferase involved in cell wall biosynthesis